MSKGPKIRPHIQYARLGDGNCTQRMTIAIIPNTKNKDFYWGLSICHEKDQFSKVIGRIRALALARSVSNFLHGLALPKPPANSGLGTYSGCYPITQDEYKNMLLRVVNLVYEWMSGNNPELDKSIHCITEENRKNIIDFIVRVYGKQYK